MNTTHETRGTAGARRADGTRRPDGVPGPVGARRTETEGERGPRPADVPAADAAAGSGRPGATRALGRYGEELAARRLTALGLRVLARNWRCGRTGEIDIVADDHGTLVICEVKTRRHGAYEHPMAAVTARKAERLRRLAACWLDRTGAPAPPGGVRIDLVGIVLPRRGAPVLTHARGVA